MAVFAGYQTISVISHSILLLLVYQIKMFSKFQAELVPIKIALDYFSAETRDFIVVLPLRTKRPLTSFDTTVAAVSITYTMSVTFTVILSGIT